MHRRAFARLHARFLGHQPIAPVIEALRNSVGIRAARDDSELREVAIAHAAAVVLVRAHLHHVGGAAVVGRRPFSARGRVVGADPIADRPIQAVVHGAVDGAVGRLHAIGVAAVVVTIGGRVIVSVLRADIGSGGPGDAAEVEVSVAAHDLAGRADVIARQGLQAANRLGAVGQAASQVRVGRHG